MADIKSIEWGGKKAAVMLALSLLSLAAVAGRDAGQIMLQEKANKAVAEKRAQMDFAPGAGAAVQKVALPLGRDTRAATAPAASKERSEKAAAGSPVND
ncbi:MAG: hypothetical protein JOY60_18045 [Burkholderiaceae bacterium]|nr:hypothetical protein [Roseateles sp.]MBV8471753.1 hypothetical protein [Burkholderiaceae bacterium]